MRSGKLSLKDLHARNALDARGMRVGLPDYDEPECRAAMVTLVTSGDGFGR